MDLVKIGKARDLFRKSEKAKKALIDAFGQGMARNDTKTFLLLIKEITAFCEREDSEIILINGVISSLLRDKRPSSEDVMIILGILDECQRDLKNYIVEKMYLSGPKSKEFTEYYTAISEYAKNKEESTREKRKELVLQQIFQTPGLYIALLTDILQEQHGKDRFSSSSIWQYIDELSQERKVITVGGPQGRERYCFPDSRVIADLSQFYHRLFAMKGIVEERVTNRFVLTSKFRDIFLVNHIERPLLLVVDYGKLHHIEGNLIVSYGDLEPFEYLVNIEGFKPRDDLLNLDILKARKVDRVVDGREEVVWLDSERANLFSYSSLERATTYSSVPSLNI